MKEPGFWREAGQVPGSRKGVESIPPLRDILGLGELLLQLLPSLAPRTLFFLGPNTAECCRHALRRRALAASSQRP